GLCSQLSQRVSPGAYSGANISAKRTIASRVRCLHLLLHRFGVACTGRFHNVRLSQEVNLMTEYLKQFLKNSVRRLIGVPELRSRLVEIQKHLDDPTNWGRVLREVVSANQGMQQILSRSYRASRHPQLPLVNLNDIEFRCFSQNGEDGI